MLLSLPGEMDHDGVSVSQSTAAHLLVHRKTGGMHCEINPPGWEGHPTVTPVTPPVAEVPLVGQLADSSVLPSPLRVLCVVKTARLAEEGCLPQERRFSPLRGI